MKNMLLSLSLVFAVSCGSSSVSDESVEQAKSRTVKYDGIVDGLMPPEFLKGRFYVVDTINIDSTTISYDGQIVQISDLALHVNSVLLEINRDSLNGFLQLYIQTWETTDFDTYSAFFEQVKSGEKIRKMRQQKLFTTNNLTH